MEQFQLSIAQRTVEDVMTLAPPSVTLDTAVDIAHRLMQQHRLDAIPVCEDGRLIGLLSASDVLRVLPGPGMSGAAHELPLARPTVAEIMQRFPVTVGPHHSVREAIRRMRSHQVEALPVTENRRVVGMLTRATLFQALSPLHPAPLIAA